MLQGCAFYTILDKQRQEGAVVLSEVLRQTRRHYLENGDPAFLAYVFYGDPYLRLR